MEIRDPIKAHGVELNGPERFLQAGSVITTFSGSPLPSVVPVGEGQTVVREGWVLDHLTPPQKVVVTGAGHDVKPLVALAQQAGFEVSVLDPRRMFNNPQVFPQAVEWVNQDAQHVDAERWPHAYWVIMNHHQDRDEHCLDLALRSQPRYVGVLGPLSRTQEMLRHINRQFEPHVAFLSVRLKSEPVPPGIKIRTGNGRFRLAIRPLTTSLSVPSPPITKSADALSSRAR
ncbi:XdhC family protein [Sulfobacillus thermotolerans]|uniref:XdhC family protein n=1 Tax=Sulfobacillus thermotolerans TaxID=338644 RepID=UPI003D2FEA9C